MDEWSFLRVILLKIHWAQMYNQEHLSDLFLLKERLNAFAFFLKILVFAVEIHSS